MEQIYTIPVNEAFEASRDDPSIGCPLCALYRKLEEDELDLILGASMMEPDIRTITNETGFCKIHSETVLSHEHLVIMKSAKALLIGLDSYVGLHHGCAEDKVKLVRLKLFIKIAKRTTAGFICR